MNVNISDLSICSTALLALGERPINSFVENNTPARLCANMYGAVRDNMLRQHVWNFAKTRVRLSPDETRPAFGYAYQFTLPGDFIRLIEVNGSQAIGAGWPYGYSVEGTKVLTDASSLEIRYIYRNDAEQTWDAAFIEVVMLAMKKALAYPITRDVAVRNASEQEWAIALKLAKTINGMELPPIDIDNNVFMEARY
jgi:hypothetical protein